MTKVESTYGYVCNVTDVYETSYYFRGNITNNYVKFGGFYWHILRINGDGSIRLVYDGTSAHDNNESSSDRIIGNSKYNSSANDNTYVGYMYGSTGASSYDATHANTNDSTIKIYIDNTTNLSKYFTYYQPMRSF
ncbi:unknown [Mycoplasma sp. CAG:956]|nr:unknown [Mycoplasma sp. CAG:956]